MEITGLSNRVLEVDLSKNKFTVYEVNEADTRLYMGGKGMALKLLYDRLIPKSDPLGESNMLVFHTGAYMGTGAPCSGRFSAAAKSPLTGIIATSSCGGPFGMALKTSGWDGLIIYGSSKKPVWLMIDSRGVSFNDAAELWGKNTVETQELLDGSGAGILTIGQAGENLVNYANISSGERFLGRAGLGAVMGSKNLKAVVAKGNEIKIIPRDRETFRKIRTSFLKDINNNHTTSVAYRKYGTASGVRWSQEKGMLPVENFRDGSHPDFEKVSGETLEKNHIKSFSTCKPCTIMCGHRGVFGGKLMKIPEYETVGMLGTVLGIFDPEHIGLWNRTCQELGLDTISAGSTIAWAMEAGENGIFKTDLRFGSPDHIQETLEDIGHNRGAGKELSRGTRWLSEKYGGVDYAIQVKGLEAAAYDPRGAIGHGLGLVTANRGADHLEGSMMAVQAFEGFSFRHIKLGVPYQVTFFEDLMAGINNLHTCQFTSYSVLGERRIVRYIPRAVIRIVNLFAPSWALTLIRLDHYFKLWESITGIKMTQREFLRSGRRTHILERYMNTREGITRLDDKLPGRFIKEYRRSDPDRHRISLKWLIKRYYHYRGYDKNGIPGEKVLKSLKITQPTLS